MISKIPTNYENAPNSGSDEKDKKLAEERAANALKLQRKQRLEAMVQKRRTNFAYLKKVHQGGTYWLNVVLFSTADIKHYVSTMVSKQRIESFFFLGLSVSKILDLPVGVSIVRAFSQLMEEWEYYHAGNTMQSVKFVMAKNSPCIYPQTVPVEGNTDLARPSIYKFNNSVVFEHLNVMHIPFDLDYVEVLLSLCDALSSLYEKFIYEDCYSNQVVYDTIVRLDLRIKHHVINLIGKELTEVSSHKLKSATNKLRTKTGIIHSIKQLFLPTSANK